MPDFLADSLYFLRMSNATTNVIAVANGFKSRQGIISEPGGGIEDVLDEIAADDELAESKGVELDADRASERRRSGYLTRRRNCQLFPAAPPTANGSHPFITLI